MRSLTLAVVFVALTSGAQNFSVRLGPVADGTIQNWPVQVQPIGESTTVTAPFILMSKAQLDNCFATNAAAYTSWERNKTYQAKAALNASIARLLVLYDGIPAARTELRTFANATNTLTTAQLTVAVRKMADYQEKIMEFLQRLGPVLKSMYRPEEDTTQ